MVKDALKMKFTDMLFVYKLKEAGYCERDELICCSMVLRKETIKIFLILVSFLIIAEQLIEIINYRC